MTEEQFDTAHRSFRRRRPFVKFEIEFASGTLLAISHPESLEKSGAMYVLRSPDGTYSVFPAEIAIRLHG
jgi:hypothetical protein